MRGALDEKGGAHRNAIWKCMQRKFPEADHKRFLLRLRAVAKEGTMVVAAKK